MPCTRFALFALLCLCLACQNRPKDKIVQKEKAIDSLKQKIGEVQLQKIKLLLNHVHTQYGFNGNALIASKGNILFQNSYGMANFEQQKKLTLPTAFPIASLTRGFTATAVLQLAERGKLRIDDTLGKFYPNFPYKKMRIIDLLQQVSGLPDYLTYFYSPTNQPVTHAYKQNILDWLLQTAPKLRFPPRKAFALSSTNYIVLADIVEKVSGVPLKQYWEENIFNPLGMKNTHLREPKKTHTFLRATGYSPDRKLLADESYVDYVYGDAGLHSTVEDLFKWEQALHSNLILIPKAVEQFQNPTILENKKVVHYSMGWHLEKAGKAQVLRGTWLGFGAQLWRVPENQQTIILLSNAQNEYLPAIAEALYAILQNEPFTLPEKKG